MFRIRDADRFAKVTSGIRNLTIVAAVVLGGLWTVWTFTALGVRARAASDRSRSDAARVEVDREHRKAAQDEARLRRLTSNPKAR